MDFIYVPYSGSAPAHVSVKGHRMIILSQDESALRRGMQEIGADRIEAIPIGDTEAEQIETIQSLARAVKAGVIIAPRNSKIGNVVNHVAQQLPWVH